MSVTIKSASEGSERTLTIHKDSNNCISLCVVDEPVYGTLDITVSKEELLKALEEEWAEKKFEFPTEIGSRIKGIHSENGETVEFLRYAHDSLPPCWIMAQKGSKWDTESIYEWITNLEVIQ